MPGGRLSGGTCAGGRFSMGTNIQTAQCTYLRLDDALSLCPQQLHRLEQVDDTFIPHPLEQDAQCYEHARSADASARHNIENIISNRRTRSTLRLVWQRLNNAISAVPNAKAIDIHGMMKPKKNIQSGIHSSTVALKKLYSFYNSNFEYSYAHYWLMNCVLLTLQIFCPAKHLLISLCKTERNNSVISDLFDMKCMFFIITKDWLHTGFMLT